MMTERKPKQRHISDLGRKRRELEQEIFDIPPGYEATIKDYLCLHTLKLEEILQNEQKKNGSQKNTYIPKPGIYMPMPHELQSGARIVCSMVRAANWEEFWLKIWDNRREIIDLLNNIENESNISLKEEEGK